MRTEVSFATSADGTRIAWSRQPAWPRFLTEVMAFVGGTRPSCARTNLTVAPDTAAAESGPFPSGIGGQPLTTEDVLTLARGVAVG